MKYARLHVLHRIKNFLNIIMTPYFNLNALTLDARVWETSAANWLALARKWRVGKLARGFLYPTHRKVRDGLHPATARFLIECGVLELD